MFIMSNTPKEQLKNATDTNHKSTDNSSNSNSTKNISAKKLEIPIISEKYFLENLLKKF